LYRFRFPVRVPSDGTDVAVLLYVAGPQHPIRRSLAGTLRPAPLATLFQRGAVGIADFGRCAEFLFERRTDLGPITHGDDDELVGHEIFLRGLLYRLCVDDGNLLGEIRVVVQG